MDILFILEIIGTIAFAISGAIVGIKKSTDIFGVVFLGVMTAVGGGVIRDILIGKIPPSMFENYIYALVATLTSLFVFVLAAANRSFFSAKWEKIDTIVNVFDALGLGVFTVNGMSVVLRSEIEHHIFLTVFVGLCTGIGGGIIRDALVNDIPFVLQKRIYALGSIIVGSIYYALYVYLQIDVFVSMSIGIFFVFAIRMLATHFKWNLPRIKINNTQM